MLCVTETKLDQTDVISVEGYSFFSQHRKQNYIRKSGGIGLFCKQNLAAKLSIIDTQTDYILWARLDKTLFNISEDLILGILYIPPSQSRFLNDDEFYDLETEITSMCSQSSFVCLTGDMNARTATLCDFIMADSFIADLFEFDQDTLRFYNQAEQLHTLNINKNRVSKDKHTNTNGYKLIEICINNNLFILNGRFGKDKMTGNFTFRKQSLIDYTICSFNCLTLLEDFEIIETDSLLSDGHSLLSWSINTYFKAPEKHEETTHSTHKKWDSKLRDDFLNNISWEKLNELYLNLEPSKQSIDQTSLVISDIFFDAASRSFPLKKSRKNSNKTFFGPKCRAARKHYHVARKRYNKFQTEHNRSQLIESSRKYKRTMNFYINRQKHSNADN